MKKVKQALLLVIGGILLVVIGIILHMIGPEVLHIPFIRLDLVPIGFSFAGVLLFVMGGSAIMNEKYKTKEQEILERDERNIAIHQSAKSKAFDFLSALLAFTLLTLAIFGYMNEVSFFTLATVFLASYVYFSIQIVRNMKSM